VKADAVFEGGGVKTVDIDMTREEGDALYENGEGAAEDFLKTWDFDQWKKLYRGAVEKKVRRKKN
jgi:hypothetical protein